MTEVRLPPIASPASITNDHDKIATTTTTTTSSMPPLTSAPPPGRQGYRLIDGSKAYYRFSDIMFEWHKQLPPHQANAVKSLLNFEALVEPTHPLQQNLGEERGVVFYIAMCRDGKPRAFMTIKQVEYLVHWIHQMELVPAKQHIPIPSSKSLLFEEDLEEIIPLVFSDPALIKRALNRPNQVYARRKAASEAAVAPVAAADVGAVGATGATVTMGEEEETSGDAKKEGEEEEETSAEQELRIEDSEMENKIKQVQEEDRVEEDEDDDEPVELDLDQAICLAAYHRAQQLLIVASSEEDLPLPADLQAQTESGSDNGGKKINFLSVHFNTLGLDTLCEVGWAKASWNEQGEEVREQGHWIVAEQEEIATDSHPYFFDESEVIPLVKIKKRLSGMMDKSTYLVIHSNLREYDEYTLVELPVVKEDHVIDTLQLVKALSSDWADATLEDAAKRMLAGSGQRITGFGNSGNDAWWHLETFLTLIGPQYDLAKELLLEEPQSDNEEEIEFQQRFHGVGLDDVEFNLDEFDYDIGPGGPEDEDDFL